MKKLSATKINGIIGKCGGLPVFLGFALSNFLWRVSFADILNEDTGEGYQRPRNLDHSRDFKNYITKPSASTIPLTFNLRKELAKNWKIIKHSNNEAILVIKNETCSLAQIDCQHRLGELKNEEIPFAFMTFIGLSLREEMALFNTINSKAKGLSSSLTDFHESNLLNDLSNEAPHLYIARKLNEDPTSPWFRLIRYGGETTSGLKRRTSLRMMQKAVHRFLKQTNGLPYNSIEDKFSLILSFWKAVKNVYKADWADNRHSLLTKGIGLYSLMYLFADLVKYNNSTNSNEEYFISILSQLKKKVSWSSNGMFSTAGGHKGAIEVYNILKKAVLK